MSLSRRIDGLATTVADVDRRLARLEGWMERDRIGDRGAPTEAGA